MATVRERIRLWWYTRTGYTITEATSGAFKVSGDHTDKFTVGTFIFADEDAEANASTNWEISSSSHSAGVTTINVVGTPTADGDGGGKLHIWRKLDFTFSRLKPIYPQNKGTRLTGRGGVQKQLISPDSVRRKAFPFEVVLRITDNERDNVSEADGLGDETLRHLSNTHWEEDHLPIYAYHQQDYLDAAGNAIGCVTSGALGKAYDLRMEPTAEMEGSQFSIDAGAEDIELSYFCNRDGHFTDWDDPTAVAWRARP